VQRKRIDAAKAIHLTKLRHRLPAKPRLEPQYAISESQRATLEFTKNPARVDVNAASGEGNTHRPPSGDYRPQRNEARRATQYVAPVSP
jgi:hypothetical protein